MNRRGLLIFHMIFFAIQLKNGFNHYASGKEYLGTVYIIIYMICIWVFYIEWSTKK